MDPGAPAADARRTTAAPLPGERLRPVGVRKGAVDLMAEVRADAALFDRLRVGRERPQGRVTWLARPVPLRVGSSLMVHGVTTDADQSLRNYWTQLGRAAAAGSAD